MKDRSTLYLACAALGTLALAAAPAPQAHDDGARAQGATNQQQSSNQSRRNELVKIVRQVTGKYYGSPSHSRRAMAISCCSAASAMTIPARWACTT